MTALAEALESLMLCDGALAAALIDPPGPRILARIGRTSEIDLAAVGHSAVVQGELAALAGGDASTGGIDDVLVTRAERYHLLRPCANRGGVFLLLVLERPAGNLALARRALQEAESQL